MRKILFAAVLGLAGVAGCAKADKAGAEVEAKLPTMTVDELDRALAAKEAWPVDCNGDKTRKRMGVVPGAILVTDEETFAASELPPDKAAKLVFYCANAG
jgi:hypothetical protein